MCGTLDEYRCHFIKLPCCCGKGGTEAAALGNANAAGGGATWLGDSAARGCKPFGELRYKIERATSQSSHERDTGTIETKRSSATIATSPIAITATTTIGQALELHRDRLTRFFQDADKVLGMPELV